MTNNSNFSKFKNGYDDASIELDDIKKINKVLKNFNTFKNTNVKKLEKGFADYLGVKYAVSFFKGRDALSSILNSLPLKKGDDVLLPAYTCIVVVNSILKSGLKPVFCDIEKDTFGPDYDSIKKNITLKTKVIIVQHLYGIVCKDYESILQYAKEKRIFIVDDCTQSTGATFKDKKLGFYADAAFYSFQHSKVISCGDGGLATTNNKILAKEIFKVQSNASDVKSDVVVGTLRLIKKLYFYNQNKFLGRWISRYYRIRSWRDPENINADEVQGNFNINKLYRLPPQLAEIAMNQLKKIDRINSERINNSKFWEEWAKSQNISTPHIIKDSSPIFLRFPLLLESDQRQKVKDIFEGKLNLGFWFSDYLSSGSKDRQPKDKGLPNATYVIKNIVNFPCL